VRHASIPFTFTILSMRYGGGSTGEDIWYDEDVITGNEVLERFNYCELRRELERRIYASSRSNQLYLALIGGYKWK
jgi:hypothetical protein